MNYIAEHRHQPLARIMLDYLKLDLLVWLFVAIVLRRIYLILRHRTAPWPLWDGLAFGGVAWFLAYQDLRMFRSYYLSAADLIALLYVGRFVLLSWKNMHSWSKAAALMLAFIVVLQDVSLSALAVFERKNYIHAKVEVASVVETRYRSGAKNVLRLFFPFANPYVIMEFAAYLNYRGVPVNSVVLATGAIAKDAPCVKWTSFKCHAASEPAPGDLVIVLPDDKASRGEASVYREPRELLFFYEPRPPIPHWLYPLVGSLYLVTPIYMPNPRPDRWMDASVSIWK